MNFPGLSTYNHSQENIISTMINDHPPVALDHKANSGSIDTGVSSFTDLKAIKAPFPRPRL